jgi:hypothetical protein
VGPAAAESAALGSQPQAQADAIGPWWANQQQGGQWGAGANGQGTQPEVNDRWVDPSTAKVDPWTEAQREPPSNPFTKVTYELAQECPVHADQAACDEAIWLGTLLSKMAKGRKSDLIDEAGKLLSLEAWFQNPAGPAGFFNFLDLDRNGYLDSDELMAYGGAGLMQVIDTDRDGLASRQECHSFLRGCAVLFEMLPKEDTRLEKVPASVMLKLADTVTLEHTVPTGPNSNPIALVAAALGSDCPEAADHASCIKGTALAKLLVKLTEDAAPKDKVTMASTILSLWFWFQNPKGPSGFFNDVDQRHKGGLTVDELLQVFGDTELAQRVLPKLVKFIDTDHDGKVSRAECQSYLRASVLLVHKLPMLDLASANTPLPDMYILADSVIKQAVTGSSTLAWGISIGLSALMIICIMYVHCCPRRSLKDKEKERAKLEAAASNASSPDSKASEQSPVPKVMSPDELEDQARTVGPQPSSSSDMGPPPSSSSDMFRAVEPDEDREASFEASAKSEPKKENAS